MDTLHTYVYVYRGRAQRNKYGRPTQSIKFVGVELRLTDSRPFVGLTGSARTNAIQQVRPPAMPLTQRVLRLFGYGSVQSGSLSSRGPCEN